MFIIIPWVLVGIINIICCALKLKADWISFWLVYASFMIVLIENYFVGG